MISRISEVGRAIANTVRTRLSEDVDRRDDGNVTGERLAPCRRNGFQDLCSGVGVSSKLEYHVQLQRLAIAIPPPGLALMARAEIDFSSVRKGQFDLDNVVGTTGLALQGCDRYSSSSTHNTKSSRTTR
jgi:hypothetical protein